MHIVEFQPACEFGSASEQQKSILQPSVSLGEIHIASSVLVLISAVVYQNGVVRRSARRVSGCRATDCHGLASGSGKVCGDDVGGVPVERGASGVVSHRRSRVGVRRAVNPRPPEPIS